MKVKQRKHETMDLTRRYAMSGGQDPDCIKYADMEMIRMERFHQREKRFWDWVERIENRINSWLNKRSIQ